MDKDRWRNVKWDVEREIEKCENYKWKCKSKMKNDRQKWTMKNILWKWQMVKCKMKNENEKS